MGNPKSIDNDISPAKAAGDEDILRGAAAPAYLIGHITVKDPLKWAEYCRNVPATVAPWGAALVFRGNGAQALAGEHAYTDTVVIRFPSRAALNGWHESAAYQAIVPIRKLAADVVIISYDGQ